MDDTRLAHEAVGRKQIEIDGLRFEYGRLLGVLQAILDGVLDPKRVSINPTDLSWKIEPPPVESSPE